MRVCTLSSSSSGNCTLVSHGDTHILIDAGISMKRIVMSLKSLGIDPGSITGILVTHEHKDHISGISMMCKYYKTSVFAPYAVADGVCGMLPQVRGVVADLPEGGVELGEITVEYFKTPHDTPASVGYRLSAGGRTFALATDTGCLTDEMLRGTQGVDAALIEANHDITMLKNGPYPSFLKRRILSEHGHMSNDMAAGFAVRLVHSGVKNIILGHLSRENNTPLLACRTVGSALAGDGVRPGVDVGLYIAPKDSMGDYFEV